MSSCMRESEDAPFGSTATKILDLDLEQPNLRSGLELPNSFSPRPQVFSRTEG